MSPSQARSAPLGGTPGALTRYRVMAMVVGTGLAVLCFVGVPLQLAGDNKWPWTAVVEIVGTLHGFLYITYLIVCLDLAGQGPVQNGAVVGHGRLRARARPRFLHGAKGDPKGQGSAGPGCRRPSRARVQPVVGAGRPAQPMNEAFGTALRAGAK